MERRLFVGCKAEWGLIKAEYISSNASLQELAEKYGVSFSTIQKKSMEEKWSSLRKKRRRKTEEKIIDSVSSKEAKKAVDLFDIADLLADKVREIAETVSDPDSIKKLTSAIKDIKDIKMIKSDIDIKEQEARIANLEKMADGDAKKPDSIEIVFAAGEEAWNE
jgi:crotonobetainyl-CoA:carnitine CoA-transferase CaiB-like acyl-CoA transferase